eukprot:TRINITY_DN842_c0_g1_i1.p1 TRINITY_DN842_c0_g1~~TRINITY_DN842_c0_g1_i1.p1  ORF type:complete len:408 (-),score=68.32 TRINITY_DN842_c0_g1_i1:16-1239(-)
MFRLARPLCLEVFPSQISLRTPKPFFGQKIIRSRVTKKIISPWKFDFLRFSFSRFATAAVASVSPSNPIEAPPSADYSVTIDEEGRYKVSLQLPNHELCSFPLFLDAQVRDLVRDIREEDPEVQTVSLHRMSGERISHDLSIRDLLSSEFTVTINGKKYHISTQQMIQPQEILTNVLGDHEIKSLIQKAYYHKILSKMEKDPRHHVPYSEYVQWCEHYGLSEQETNQLIRALHRTGMALHYEIHPELKDLVFLRPDSVFKNINEQLNLKYIKVGHPELEEELIKLRELIKPLDEIKNQLEHEANTFASRMLYVGFAYTAVQFTILARMVWWEFNWDIMEPVTYFVTLGTVMFGYTFYVITSEDYTYKELKYRIARRKLRKLYLEAEFDWPRWNRINQRIKVLEEGLA